MELNEAFASQAVYCIRELGLDPAIVNVNGGAIALGHPLGATGAKLTATLLHEMKRRQSRYGVVSMCVAGGIGAAAVFERSRPAASNSDSQVGGIMALGKYAVDYEQRVDYPRLRAERLQRAKDQINKDGLGAVVTWDEANVRYLTGYYITTPNRPLEAQFAFVARNGDPHIIGGNDQEGLIKRMPWMGGRIHAPAAIPKMAAFTPDDPVVQRTWSTRSSTSWSEYGVEKEPLGIDGTTLSYIYAEAFKKRGIQVVHAKPTMDFARMIKTADEIELMRITCANSEKAFAAIVDAIRPGHPGVRPGGHRHQGPLRGGRRPHRGPGVLLRPQHQPLRLVLHRQAHPGGRPGLHRRGRRLLPGLQVLHLPDVLLRQGHRKSRRTSTKSAGPCSTTA